ncbi:excalibur calcium-binding domain-containing protein [Corynebacterium suranareeae]|nr:excalibur calcium-binding domain-containing protein [Corynebacterium suranareeae]
MQSRAVLGFSSLLLMGLITACDADTSESSSSEITVTQVVTTTQTTSEEASTVTETVAEVAPVEEIGQEIVEPAAVEYIPEPETYVNTPQHFAEIPAPPPAPVQSYYANCAAVRAAGAAPLYAGSPGYSSKLDRDGDGIACE